MYSATEERLRSFVEKLSEALTQEAHVIVRPGDSWAAYPENDPPMLTYKLADAAVLGDETLGVTAHEIAHLLYTTGFEWHFDIGQRPKAAHLLWNAVEDNRIERVFSEHFPGARSLFDSLREGVYDGKVASGWMGLPIKWRFILNIDRVLHGLDPWGDDRDIDALERAIDDCVDAVLTDSSQECADKLEGPFQILVDLIEEEKKEREAEEAKRRAEEEAERKKQEVVVIQDDGDILPDDYVRNAPDDDDIDKAQNDDVSYVSFDGADEDDGKPGGEDGTPGKREDGRGPKGSGDDDGDDDDPIWETWDDDDRLSDEDDPDGEGGAAGGDRGNPGEGDEGSDWDSDAGGAASSGSSGSGGDVNDGSDGMEPDDDEDISRDDSVKPTNIIEEMLAEEAGSSNKTIKELAKKMKQRAKETKEVEKKIASEYDAQFGDLASAMDVMLTPEFRERMRDNLAKYRQDVAELRPQIQTLKAYADSVLRDNERERYGGNHSSGRRIKTNRLYRIVNDDSRLFERRELVGGKSYDIVVVLDQSTSMQGAGKIDLAYRAGLVFLEAFEDVKGVGTGMVGFSQRQVNRRTGNDTKYGRMKNYGRRFYHDLSFRDFQQYKELEAPLSTRAPLLADLGRVYQTTPMNAGVRAGVAMLEKSTAQTRALVLLTDGEPDNDVLAYSELMKARVRGINTHALYIGGLGMPDAYKEKGLSFLARAVDHVQVVDNVGAIPTAVYRTMRSIIRRNRGMA